MCTEPSPAAVVAAEHFVTANLGNPGLCPGTAELEQEVLAVLLDLFHAPRFGAGGWLLSGGTEANITALWIARNAAGPGRREVVLPESAHFSFSKALDLLGLRPRWVPLDEQGRSTLDGVRRALSPRTLAMIAIAGTTELGAVDPIEELAELALARRVPLHVDAAFGGFVLPWRKSRATARPLRFDLALPGVSSLAVDPHKMGMAPVAAGALLVRKAEEASAITVPSPYLSAPQNVGLLGTRASSAVAATYCALMGLGHEGYRRNVERCVALTRRLMEGGQRAGLVPVVEPTLNIVAFHHPNPMAVQTWMLERGWDVSAIPRPSALRFVVMPHATERTVLLLLKDLARAVRAFPP
jgi:tyrosine decarboxylase / aspartate 1-decarboxylase